MKPYPRMAALLLALLLALGCTGCGKKQEPVTVTIWHVYGGETESPLNDLIDTFNDTIGLPQNIEELLSGFRDRVQTLTPMERTVLQYYIDGCSLEEVAARAYISVSTAKKHNTNINRKLGVTPREELMLYIDLFRRCGRLDEIAAPQAEDTARCTT